MENDLLFKYLAFTSPFVAAILASFLTHRLGGQAGKKDYLNQNRVAAYKDITAKLIGLKKYCQGKILEMQSNSFLPYFDLKNCLQYRDDITHMVDANELFLSNKSKVILRSVIKKLSLLCNMEVVILGITDEEEIRTYYSIYPIILAETDICLKELYLELGVK